MDLGVCHLDIPPEWSYSPGVDDEEAAFNRALGKRIRLRRREAHLSQSALADAVGLSRTSMTNIEAGRQSVASYTLAELASRLEVSADALIGLRTTRLPPGDVRRLFPELKRRDERDFVARALSQVREEANANQGDDPTPR